MNIKTRILIAVLFLELTGYSFILFYNKLHSEQALSTIRNNHIVDLVLSAEKSINNLTDLMERNAKDIAIFGESIYTLHKANPQLETVPLIQQFLVKNFSNFPISIGGGLWFEPFHYAGQLYFGPYAYRDENNKVIFTWDLNTLDYDYHNQDWYRLAIPKNKANKHINDFYWTSPYYDEAGSFALMITVDAVMRDDNNKVIGIATVDWAMERMTKDIEKLKITPNSHTFVLDTGSKKFVSYTKNVKHIMKSLPIEPWTLDVISSATQNLIQESSNVIIDDQPYHIYYIKTKIGLVFGIMIPDEELVYEIKKLSDANLLIGFIISLLFISSMFVLLHISFKPFTHVLKLISTSIVADRRGEINVSKLQYNEHNEFTPIINTLNQVYENIINYTNIIEETNRSLDTQQKINTQLNQSLEDKVQERTKALADKTRELSKSLEQLEETKDMLIDAEKNAALSRVIAGISHEVNTPIGIVLTAASHLQDRLADFKKSFDEKSSSNEEIEILINSGIEACNLIQTNVNRASSLIKSFKEVAVDQFSESRRIFNLKIYLNEIWLSIKPEYRHFKIAMNIDCPDNIIIDGYPGKLAQVITNLLINSKIHGFENRDTGIINIICTLNDDNLIIRYQDNGVGISQANKDKIFEPFFTTKRGFGGSGLGMHIIMNIITQNFGGTVQVNEIQVEDHKFTEFLFKLPRSFNEINITEA